MAAWMLPPVVRDNRWSVGLGVCCRALLRFAAALLTVLLVAQLAAVSLDLLATQCLAPGGACLRGVLPGWVRDTAAIRPLLGVLPPLLVVLVLWGVSRVTWAAGDTEPTPEPATLSRLPGVHRVADPDAPALRTLHLTAALAAVTVLALGGPGGPAGGVPVLVSWLVAVVLGVGSLLLTLVLGDPTGARPGSPGRWLLTALSPVPRRVVLLVAVLTVCSVPVVRSHWTGPLTGTDPTLTVVAVALGGACVLLGLLLVPAAVLARSTWAALPVELRPWAGGWLAAPFLTLAALLGGGFGAGVAITVRQALGGRPLALPRGYAFVTLVWGVAGALAVAGLVVVLLVTGARRLLFGVRVPEEIGLLHVGRPADARRAAPAWRAAAWERGHAHHVLLALAGVLAAGAIVSAGPWRTGALPPAWTEPLAGVGLAVLALLAAWLLREVYAAARRPESARHVGGLADLAGFWPRESHPVVPPCYALKVVPEIAARAAEYLAEPNTRVVLTGHDQGSMIAVAAAARLLGHLSPDQVRRLGVVVAGSPLQWAYPRAFPDAVPHAGLRALFGELDGRWRTMARGSDPAGGGVTTWRRQVFDGQLIGVGFRPDGTSGALSPAVAGPTGALALGGDHWLPDPERGPFPGRRWAAGVLRHSDYYSDPEWDRAIACAAGLESPDELPREEAGLFRLPRPKTATG
jgi:hypothetical protein